MTTDWNSVASNILKAEVKRRGLTYEQLQEKLKEIGVDETTSAIRLKANRGAFQFAFFLQCAAALGIKNLRLDDLISEKTNQE
jgi:hypothetical protein